MYRLAKISFMTNVKRFFMNSSTTINHRFFDDRKVSYGSIRDIAPEIKRLELDMKFSNRRVPLESLTTTKKSFVTDIHPIIRKRIYYLETTHENITKL